MRNHENRLALGVDRGGTSTRLLLIDGRGKELKRAVFPSASFRLLPALLIKTAAAWGIGPEVPAVIASRGVMTRKWKKPFLLKKTRGKINLVAVISDAEAAYLAAHGTKTGAALLIAGTGAVLFFKNPRNGEFIKTGGFLPPGGDPGSGLWLGARYLRISGKRRKGIGRREAAAFASSALTAAKKGNAAAMELVREAQSHLSDLLAEALRHRAAPRPLKLALAGGLMGDEFFRKGFISSARERTPRGRVVFTGLARSAERAAADLAVSIYYARNKNP